MDNKNNGTKQRKMRKQILLDTLRPRRYLYAIATTTTTAITRRKTMIRMLVTMAI